MVTEPISMAKVMMIWQEARCRLAESQQVSCGHQWSLVSLHIGPDATALTRRTA